MSNETGTNPSDETHAAEEAEAHASHQADRPPTEEEGRAAPTSASPETERAFDDMAKRGADVKGEGQVP
ncbi:MAG TPA: hypothetical protein VFN68_08610 [Acidimicrobiales bacterium]|nr:hypothetical protein [Acidimicrobiales bacterium]